MKRDWNISAEVRVMGLVLAATLATSWWVAQKQSELMARSLRSELLHQAVAVAQTVNPLRVAELSFSKEDRNNPAYQRLCAQITAYKSALNCRGICTLALRDGKLLFGPESYPPDDPIASVPGTPYLEPQPEDSAIFQNGKAYVRGPQKDEYGDFMFAAAPVLDPSTGKVIMAVGIDMLSSQWREILAREKIHAGLKVLPLGLVLIAGIWLSGRRKRSPDSLKGLLRHVEAATVALFFAILTMLIALELHQRDRLAQRNVFSQLAANQAYRLGSQFQHLRDHTLSSLSHLYENSERVSRREFEEFVAPLLRESCLFGIFWVERVRQEELGAWLDKHKDDGYPSPAIWEAGPDGKRKPSSGHQEVYYPICHSATHEGFGLITGLDEGADPVRRGLIEETIRDGLIMSSPPLDLATDPDNEKGILVFLPVFKGKGGDRALRGVALAVFDPSALIRTTMGPMPPEALTSHITLHQLSAVPGASIFITSSEEDAAVASPGYRFESSRELTQIYPIFAFGRAYAISFSPGEGFLSAYPVDPMWPVLTTGFIIAALLTLLTAFLIRRHTVLETLVERRTKELRESETNYRLAEERESHLNRMLMSIRNVNQLIVREQDRSRLIEAACRNLTETLGYFTAWIVLLDGAGNLESFAAAGLGEDAERLRKRLAEKKLPTCMRSVLSGDKLFRSLSPSESCEGVCELSRSRQGAAEIAARIEFEGERFGVLVVSIPVQLAQDKLAADLFAELADDLGFALHKVATADALVESEMRFRSLVEGAPDAIFVAIDRKFVYLNQSAATLFGAANGDALVGRPILDRFKPEEQENATTLLRQITEEKAPSPATEVSIVRIDGTTLATECSAVPIRFRGQDGALVFAHDVSGRKQAEEHRRKLEEQLHQARKLESLGQLAGGVAHDFNNMLQVILGHVEMLVMSAKPDSPDAEALQEIQKAGMRAAEVTRQLLAFARKQPINPRPIDLNETVSDLLKMLGRLIGEQNELRWYPGTGLPQVKMDPSQINQILTNLAVNCRDAISGHGNITIETSQTVISDSDQFEGAKFAPGHYVVLSISDDGEGMSKETLSHIFEPFFTTKPTGRGTGLGLSTIYGIVRQCNGYIYVYSEVGIGTTFRIYLPASREDTQEEKPEPAVPEEPAHKRMTVLIAEDEPALLAFARKLLEQMGYTVLAASGAAEALQIAENSQVDIDLLLTDMVMPEMSGVELQKRLLSQRPKLKSLFMSGYTPDAIAQHNVLDKGIHFLQKPFSSGDLRMAIRAALR